MEEATIRPAQSEDLWAVQAVAKVAWHATYAGHIPVADIEGFMERNYSPAALSVSLERLGAGLLVAELGGQVCGYAQVGRNGASACELFAVYVTPAAHGLGAGYALWNAALAHARTLGCAELELWVLAENERARRFYARQGAQPTESRPYPVGAMSITEVRYVVTL